MSKSENVVISKYRVLLVTVLIVYLALLAWLSLVPASTFSGSFINFKGADKIVHGMIYFILGFLLFLLARDVIPRTGFKFNALVFTLGSAYGLLLELMQLWITVSSRSFEYGDIASNCVGIAVGMACASAVLPRLTSYLKQD